MYNPLSKEYFWNLQKRPPDSSHSVNYIITVQVVMLLVQVEHERHTRAAMIPHVGILFKPLDAAHKRCTSVKPFSFEERNKKMLEVKEERIRRVLEAEKKVSLA